MAIGVLLLADGIQIREAPSGPEARLTVSGIRWKNVLLANRGMPTESKARQVVLTFVWDQYQERTAKPPQTAPAEALAADKTPGGRENGPPEAPAELPDLVTLDQAAAGPAATFEGENRPPVPDASGSKASPPIDFEALVNALLEREKPTQAALVRFMADRETATAEEIGDNVHGNPEASDKAIGKNARETTDSLAGIGSRLSFRFVSGTMFRKIAAE
jgi:hypothetical protein